MVLALTLAARPALGPVMGLVAAAAPARLAVVLPVSGAAWRPAAGGLGRRAVGAVWAFALARLI